MKLYFDVETAPRPLEEIEKILPYELADELPPDDWQTNWKPETRLDKWPAEREKKIAAWLEKSQLFATRSFVCAVGVAVDEGKPEMLFGDEAEMLTWLVGRIDEADEVIGHYIGGFDCPYIWRRCALLGLPKPQWWQGRYLAPKFFDTCELWQRWQGSRCDEPAGMDAIAGAFGLDKKPGNGKDFWRYDRPQQELYLAHDLNTTREIYRLLA